MSWKAVKHSRITAEYRVLGTLFGRRSANWK